MMNGICAIGKYWEIKLAVYLTYCLMEKTWILFMKAAILKKNCFKYANMYGETFLDLMWYSKVYCAWAYGHSCPTQSPKNGFILKGNMVF
jgi:hypothetical protein